MKDLITKEELNSLKKKKILVVVESPNKNNEC